jgi:hypothetical protein
MTMGLSTPSGSNNLADARMLVRARGVFEMSHGDETGTSTGDGRGPQTSSRGPSRRSSTLSLRRGSTLKRADPRHAIHAEYERRADICLSRARTSAARECKEALEHYISKLDVEGDMAAKEEAHAKRASLQRQLSGQKKAGWGASGRKSTSARSPHMYGIESREPLCDEVARTTSWWSPIPETHLTSAGAFDERHERLTRLGCERLSSANGSGGGASVESVLGVEYREVLTDVFRNRYVVDEGLPEPTLHRPPRRQRPPSHPPWRLEDSVWRDRPLYNDSKAFDDSRSCKRRALEALYRLVVGANHARLRRFILQSDGESDREAEERMERAIRAMAEAERMQREEQEERERLVRERAERERRRHLETAKLTQWSEIDEELKAKEHARAARERAAAAAERGTSSGGGAASPSSVRMAHPRGAADSYEEEVAEVLEVLWDYIQPVDVVFGSFDYYAMIAGPYTGNVEAVTFINQKAFSQFIEDCKLAWPHSKLRLEVFDQLFVLVDVQIAGGEVEEVGANRKRVLNRREFVEVLIRIAILRYVTTGETVDVSDAVDRLLLHMKRTLPALALQDTARFRDKYCYQPEIDSILLRWEGSLRALYEGYCKARGGVSVCVSQSSLGYAEWMEMVSALGLLDDGFSRREATSCFLWSRMRCIEDGTIRQRIKMTHCCFEDFLEAITRVASMKTLPTLSMAAERGMSDVGECALWMRRNERDVYDAYVRRARNQTSKEAARRLARQSTAKIALKALTHVDTCDDPDAANLVDALLEPAEGRGESPLHGSVPRKITRMHSTATLDMRSSLAHDLEGLISLIVRTVEAGQGAFRSAADLVLSEREVSNFRWKS